MSKQYEYLIFERAKVHVPHGNPVPCCPEIQNLGLQGWEMVAVLPLHFPSGSSEIPEYNFIFWFKREL